MGNAEMVSISLDRYDELLDLETRVNVAVEKIVRCNYISTEDLLFILGTELALSKAEELHKEAEEFENKVKVERELGISILTEE